MTQATLVRDRTLRHGVCFVQYQQHDEAVHSLFAEVHQKLGAELDVYSYISVHQSVLGMFLSRVEVDQGVEITNARPLGRRLLSLQGKLPRKVLLSLERSQGQEGDLTTLLSDCINAQKYEPGWFYLLVGLTPAILEYLVTTQPRLKRRFFMGNELVVTLGE